MDCSTISTEPWGTIDVDAPVLGIDEPSEPGSAGDVLVELGALLGEVVTR